MKSSYYDMFLLKEIFLALSMLISIFNYLLSFQLMFSFNIY